MFCCNKTNSGLVSACASMPIGMQYFEVLAVDKAATVVEGPIVQVFPTCQVVSF